MLSSHSYSRSGIASNAVPFYGTTMKVQWYLMPELTIITLHMPILVCMSGYRCATLFNVMDFFSTFIFVCRNHICTFWLVLNHHYYLCLFYIHIYLFLTNFYFSFAIMTDLMLWRLRIFDLTTSNFVGCWDLNLSLNNLDNHVLVLHISCFSSWKLLLLYVL